MSLLDELMDTSRRDRIDHLEEYVVKGNQLKGDFEGSVTGIWQRFDAETGGGVVSYKNKEYLTKPIGFTALPAGTPIEMTHTNGIYYTKF